MKLAALCCTFRRPHTLGQLVESFLRQDYPAELRELVILDDAGQYENQAGDGWRLVSIPRRFRSLGEKRNACAALASPDVEGVLIADDDDIYLPHWFRATAEALSQAEWSRPGLVLLEHGDGLKEHDTAGLYHGGWAFRKTAFDRVRGYGPHNNGEDQELAGRLNEAGVTAFDPCELNDPFYIYRYDNCSYHLSYMDDNGYRELGNDRDQTKSTVAAGWPRDFSTLPVIRRFTFAPHVSHDDGKMRVELIGPVDSPGGNGPSNGMFALQKELKKRIAEGLDWLSIKSLPVSKGALPWFWNWADRRYAAWWDSEGLPFVQGPNMLFTDSSCPRIDAEECALLDAKNCRAMFCHSEWYRDLITKHRGPDNQSEIVMWPYPIDPRPGGPLSDKYDLLIYAKNGHRPQLLEHLAELYPRHIQIHYGKYKREELYAAARQSRACAYLADDDHGPLALQEILLAGCPTVGVRTGAPFVEHGKTGFVVDRLPPGRQCVSGDEDAAALAKFLQAIDQAQSQSRKTVRLCAMEIFDTKHVVENVIDVLANIRKSIASDAVTADHLQKGNGIP
ncbi:glycosyltransferase [Bremerella sp. P1]|uniref:glycosyltransferase n=1 Tax=Bremerella sp. P1 TaxID=3026424 RepID=UPI00236811B6|nr:glycosyltransferase [Bremerella sp. P1]WDI40525.1 glycosyltransferase [Bremerella sp. P1]